MSIRKINANNYEDNVILSVKPVLINMRSPLCKQCDDTEKLLLDIAEEYGDIVDVLELSLELQPELTELFEIRSLPMIVMMTGGVITKKVYGVPNKRDFIEDMELETIRDFKSKGINYHPKRNYIPDYIRNEF